MERYTIHPMDHFGNTYPIDARWRRVADLANSNMRPRHELDDEWIRRGWSYVNRLQACRSQIERDQLAAEVPDIHGAYQLHISTDKLERAIVEARLLGRQSIEDVAAACGLLPAAVAAYEALFFRVLGRLDAFCFILPSAVGLRLSDGEFSEDAPDVLLKWIAYQHGPVLMEQVLRYFRNGLRLPERFGQATRGELQEVVAMLQVRSILLMLCLPFPACRRALTVLALSIELNSYLASLEGVPHAFAPAAGQAGEFSMEELVASGPTNLVDVICTLHWWPAFREAVLAA